MNFKLWLLNVILPGIINALSPMLRGVLHTAASSLCDKAKDTANKTDDIFVKLLCDILDVDCEI